MANPFEKFLSFSKLSFWSRKRDQVLGIDIGTSSIKVVQLRRDHGGVVLETYGEIATGPYRDLAVGQVALLAPDKQAEVIRDLFKEANVTTDQVSCAIPLGSSLLVTITIPKVDEALLPKVIPLEARKYIPVPISEVALDWWVIPNQQLNPEETAPNQLEVLVVAIHNATISQYQAIAQNLGVTPAFFEIETFSAMRSSFAGDMSTTAILDLGAGTTKMVIVDYGIVRLSHTIGKGAQDLTVAISRSLGVDFAKAEEIKRRVGLVERLESGEEISRTVSSILDYIFLEVTKVINDFQLKQKKTVSKIVLIGGGALLKGLLEVATKSFNIPVVVGRPFEKVEAPAFLEKVLTEAGPGFAVAIGLALRQLQGLE